MLRVSSNWNRINLAIRQALEGITLTEMAQPLPDRRLFGGGAKPLSRADEQTGAARSGHEPPGPAA